MARRVVLTLPDELHAAIDAEADGEHRTVSDQIYVILERMFVAGQVGPVEQVRALADLRAHIDRRLDRIERALGGPPTTLTEVYASRVVAPPAVPGWQVASQFDGVPHPPSSDATTGS
jgi:hypothetical protein